MKTIKENIKNEIIINKSRFIGLLYKVNNIDEINLILNNLKSEYKDATHYCYAYILDKTKRFSDDGEPGGTAGMPILNVLENNEINFVLMVVIRYFGGIKLGAGGLVRAYSKCTSKLVELSNTVELVNGYEIDLVFSYEQLKVVEKYISIINNKEFGENIIFNINISIEEFEKIKPILDLENIKYSIIKTLLVEK